MRVPSINLSYLCDMEKMKMIDTFHALGERLRTFGNDTASREVIAKAEAENEWFSSADIHYAIETLRTTMLRKDILTEWLRRYDSPCRSTKPNDIGVIMAGNIPLVGFSDMLCVLMAGDNCHVKPSGKDRILIDFTISLLREIDPQIPIYYLTEGKLPDGVIASGSDNSGRYFRSIYRSVPTLIRGSRSSAAILTGDESGIELEGLACDMFRYGGLGCRNVSLILLPPAYDIHRLAHFLSEVGSKMVGIKYRNSYRRNKALLTMQGMPYQDGGFFTLVQADDFPAVISQINYLYYETPDEAVTWLSRHDKQLQCVVSRSFSYPRSVYFGKAQSPMPWDYPDGKDVLAFLYDIRNGKNYQTY